MAVTIDTKKQKEKAAKKLRAEAPPEERPAEFDDYALPIVKKNGLIALGVWIGIMLVLCEPFWLNSDLIAFAIGMNAWWIISTVAYLFVGPNLIIRRLRVDGPEAEINEQTQPRLRALIRKGGGLLGVSGIEGFIEKEGIASTFAYPNAIVIRKEIFSLLTPDELNCLAVRDLVHIRQHHARRMIMMHLIQVADPPILRYLVWPVTLYASLLRSMWVQHAQIECDRISILLIKNTKLMVSAIVKEYANRDENMKALNVTTQDVTNWIQQSGHIGMAGEEISTQYKLGRAIHEDTPLEERLQELQKWADSQDFKIAVQKLADSQKKPG